MRIDRIKFVSELAKKDMTIKRLSEISKVSAATLSCIKNGKSCSSGTAQKIAKALGVDVTEIML